MSRMSARRSPSMVRRPSSRAAASAVLAALIVGASASSTSRQDDRRPPRTRAAATAVIQERWGTRLEALEPANPTAYLELGEEIEDARQTGPAAAGDLVAEEERVLVRRLFSLAGRLDPELAAPAARAIADLTADGRERRRLLIVAELLEGDRVLRGRPIRIEGVPLGAGAAAPPEVLRAASAAISLHRRGEGADALRILAAHDEDDVRAAFATWPGGHAAFVIDCGRRRPSPSVRRLLREIAAELRMLEGDAADWTSLARAGGGDPFEEVDARDLGGLFDVPDVEAVRWRDGEWERPDAASG